MAFLCYLLVLVLLYNQVLADPIDPEDLSFYTKGAAIGDSYAAGIGAGNKISKGCARYDGSYANLVALQLGVEPNALDFTYTACSGAVVKEVNDQAKKLSTGQEFIIISAGGNDADFVGILNLCVYTFWIPKLKSIPCDGQLAKSQKTIESTGFASRLDSLIGTAKSKLAAGGKMCSKRSVDII